MSNEEKALQASVFLDAVNKAQELVREQYNLIQQAISNPKVLFTEAHPIFGSWHAAIFQMLTYPINKSDIKVHELQIFLASLIDTFVKEWCTSKGITSEIQVKVRNPKSFPSIFAIFSNELEIMQFNIFEKKYGVRVKALSKEEALEKQENEMQHQQKSIDEVTKTLQLKRDVKANPYHYTKNFRERVTIWIKMKTLQTNVDKQIEHLENNIQIMEKNKADYEARVTQFTVLNQIKKELIDQLTPLFTEYDYTLEKMESALY